MTISARDRSFYPYLPSVLLVSLEAVVSLASPLLAHLMREGTLSAAILPIAVVYAVMALLSMFALGLYTSRRSSLPALLLRIGLALGATAFISSRLYEWLPALAAGAGLVTIATAILFLVSGTIRILFDCVLDHEALPRVVLVFGAGRRAAQIARLRRRSDRRSFTVLGYVISPGDQFDAIHGDLRVDVWDNLCTYCEELGVQEIVVAVDDQHRGLPLHQLQQCRLAGIAVIGLSAFLERELGGIRLDAMTSPIPEQAPAEVSIDVRTTNLTNAHQGTE
jgi:FlaA1/EpsC-like NDP-sugar epimerase